jgi:Ni,Fe-hydrogenase III large subunit
MPEFDVVMGGGDAMARLRVRWAEIDDSVALIQAALRRLPKHTGPLREPVASGTGSALGWAEGPQGEELYSVEIENGRIRRCFARSASLHNLVLLHDVFHGDVLTDFPFIEASFGLCYAGVAM